MDKNAYKELMKQYFSQEGEDALKDWKECILQKKREGKLSLLWGSLLLGRLGMQVRNWMRSQAKCIDEEISKLKDGYEKFEDLTWNVFEEIVKEWEEEGKK